MVLSTLATLLSQEAVPLLLNDILPLTRHSVGSVRKKAVVVLKKVLQRCKKVW
jgi:hypothetical protein